MADNKPLTPEEFVIKLVDIIHDDELAIRMVTARDESIRREALQKAAIAICWMCNRPNEYRNIASDGTHEQIATGNHEWCDARLIYDMMRGLPIDTPPAAERARVWKFERYRDGLKMAEGARVHAATEDEAIEKARNLFQKDAPNSTFKLVSPADSKQREGKGESK
jgi:hypothetical protein